MFRPTRRAALLGLATLTTLPLPARATPKKGLGIVATTGMIADAVGRVGGERVAVAGLMGPGVDPHTYRQTRSDIAAMVRADAVFWHGLYLEAQLEGFLGDLARRKPVIPLADALPKERLLPNGVYAGRYDPHVWMNPRLWMTVVEAARDHLIRLDPAGADLFGDNASRHLVELGQLADYAGQVLSSIPQGSRVLVTAHDAFNYFGQAYGLEVRGIQGISTESEAGLKQVEELVALLIQRRIGAIFVESSVSDRNVKALLEGAAARGHTVMVGGELFSDAMGPPGTYEGTYLGMIDHNVTAIARALGGDAPQRGFNGRLGA